MKLFLAILGFYCLGILSVGAQSTTSKGNFVYHYQQQVSEIVQIVQAPDNKLVVAGKSSDVVIIAQFLANGEKEWSYRLNSDSKITFGDVAIGPDGNTWLVSQEKDGLVISTINANGSLNWQQRYQPPQEEDPSLLPKSLVERNGIMTVFGFMGNAADDAFTMNIGKDGEFERFQTHENSTSEPRGTATTAADGDLIAGYSGNLFILGGSSQPLFDKELQSPNSEIVNLEALPNGSFYALLTNENGAQFQLAKISDGGDLLWRTRKLRISGSASTQASGLALAPDNGAFVTGRVNTEGTVPRNLPAVIKVTPDGSFGSLHYMKDTVTNSPVYANALSMIQGPLGNRNYYITGQSSQVTDVGDLFLIRADSLTQNPTCVNSTNFSTADPAPLSLQDQALARNFISNFDVSKTSSISLEDVRLKRTVKCLACNPVEVDLGSDTTICPDQDLTLSTGFPGSDHTWSNGIQDTSAIKPAREGTYWVSINTLCGQSSDTVEFNKYPRIRSEATVKPEEPDPDSLVTFRTLNDLVRRPTWQVDSNTTLNGQEVNHRYEEFGRYEPILTYRGPNNCQFQDTLGPLPVLRFKLFMPDAFSPNNDGVNEVFKPKGFGFDTYILKIYNRWGEQVFKGIDQGWDGDYNGKPASVGIYIYQLELRTIFNNVKIREGKVTLVK